MYDKEYYLKNKEKRQLYLLKNKNIIQLKSKEYYKKNKDKRKQYLEKNKERFKEYRDKYNKQYYMNKKNDMEFMKRRRERTNKYDRRPSVKERRKLRSIQNREKLIKYFKEYHNRPDINQKGIRMRKEYYKNPKNRLRILQYQKNHPEMRLKSQRKTLKKIGEIFDLSTIEYQYAIISWSKLIKTRDMACVICGSKKLLEAHHIIHKKYYPQLSLNPNNGITLCKKHHYESHNRNMIKK